MSSPRPESPAVGPLRRTCLGADAVTFHAYRPDWREAFEALNRAWITRLFHMEATDEEVLRDPQGCILDLGGEVFFACLGERVVGTCALVPLGSGSWEVIKLAVDPPCQGRGIGHVLVGLCVEAARARGASALMARTSPRLRSSHHLFTTLGFEDLGEDPSGDFERETILLRMKLA